jgi:hypothetical protein
VDASRAPKYLSNSKKVATYHHDLISRNYTFSKPGLEKDSWNAICMEVIDPFGNKLLFSERQ